MKKSQVLAALALAFALGVVAPVAGTYALITDEQGVTSEQKEEVYTQIDILKKDVEKLENYPEYVGLVLVLEGKPSADGKSGTIERLTNWQKGWLLNAYNSGLTDSRNVNANIKAFNDILAKYASEIKAAELPAVKDKAHDNFRTMKEFVKESSVDSAYVAVQKVIETAELNLSIMRNNYDTGENVIEQINQKLAAIISALKTADSTWIKDVEGSANGMFLDGSTTLIDLGDLADDIKTIDFDAYDKMVKNANWTSLDVAAGMEQVADLELIIDTAKGLPKYALANNLRNAIDNANLVEKDNPANIEYSNAVKYANALRDAIEAYKTGKAPSGTGTGDGTNNDDTKPGLTSPDTGALANAEGNATTTVAMVAGVATALTAAGAGVVAYRNARRSSRK